MYEKTRYTSKWPESSEVRQSTGTSRARIEGGAGTLYGCYRYRWSVKHLPKGRTLARCSAVESSLDEELSGFVLETLRDGGEFALYRVRQHGRCCGSAVLRAARRVGRRRVGEQVSMNCNPASLPFLAPANCAADPVAGMISEYPGLRRMANTSPGTPCTYAILRLLISVYRYTFRAEKSAVGCGLRSEHDCASRFCW